MKILLILAFSGIFLECCEFMEIDNCLDLGGRWEYENERCDFGDKSVPENWNIPENWK